MKAPQPETNIERLKRRVEELEVKVLLEALARSAGDPINRRYFRLKEAFDRDE